MKLYEIDAAIAALIDENGEVIDLETLDLLTMAREQKIENVVMLVKDLRASVEALKAEEKTLSDRRDTYENNIERLKEWLRYALAGSKFSTPKCSVSWRRNNVAVIDEPAVMAYAVENNRDDLLVYPEPKLARKVITECLKSGDEIPGAHFEEKLSVIIK